MVGAKVYFIAWRIQPVLSEPLVELPRNDYSGLGLAVGFVMIAASNVNSLFAERMSNRLVLALNNQ